jgi:acetyl-CoA acetyltransferase
MISRAVAIVGIGQTAYGKALPSAARELAMEAVLAACADAGVDVADVDGAREPHAPPVVLAGSRRPDAGGTSARDTARLGDGRLRALCHGGERPER